MRTKTSHALGGLALALTLGLTGCASPADSTPSSSDPPASSSPSTQAPSTESPSTGGDTGDGSTADLSEFPAHFPLPDREPTFVDRINYRWTIDYAFDDDEEPLERAGWFGDNGYEAVELSEKVAAEAAPNAQTWGWENAEFRVELVLTPAGAGYVFRYDVLWK